jgi:hypothetical protein
MICIGNFKKNLFIFVISVANPKNFVVFAFTCVEKPCAVFCYTKIVDPLCKKLKITKKRINYSGLRMPLLIQECMNDVEC